MRQMILTTTAAMLIGVSAHAETDTIPNPEPDKGTSLMERGAQMFLEGIMREMEPTLEDLKGLSDEMGPALRQFVDQMGPAFVELLNDIEDLSAYHPPEILPNGDIILRRKQQDPLENQPDGEIEI